MPIVQSVLWFEVNNYEYWLSITAFLFLGWHSLTQQIQMK